jgi:tetratricopeptide (TPR) repeat protein
MNSPDAVPERRSAARVFSKRTAQIRPKGTGAFRTAVTRDVSSQAAYFYTDEAFAEGQQVELQPFDLPSDGLIHESVAKYLGKVVRLDCIEPHRKYGIAVALDRREPVPENRLADYSAPRARNHSGSLLSQAGLLFETRDVRVTTVALVTIIFLFIATSLLVGGFREHESIVSRSWSEHGQRAIAAGKPETAITDFRAVLGSTPDNPEVGLQLAQALVAAGKLDEAKGYCLVLWKREPNSGSLNLALARLEAQSGNAAEAQGYYRAAISGSWTGDAVASRQRTRLELVRYLLSRKAYGAAQPELLMLAQNTPDDLALLNETASLLMNAGDPEHALVVYNRVLNIAPQNKSALLGAGEAAYAIGRYVTAQRFLNLLGRSPGQNPEPQFIRVQETLSSINEVLSAFPGPGLPAGERADRVLRAWDTATRRLASCANISLGSMLYARTENEMPAVSSALATAYGHWRNIHTRMKTSQQRWALRNDPVLQSQIMSVAYEIEQQTVQTCGTPTGADEALLRIAQHPEGVQQ